MGIHRYLALCLEEAALVVSDGSRPLTETQASEIADALIRDEKLSFAFDAWDAVSVEGQTYLATAVRQAAGDGLLADDAAGIAKHLIWYEMRLGITYTP